MKKLILFLLSLGLLSGQVFGQEEALEPPVIIEEGLEPPVIIEEAAEMPAEGAEAPAEAVETPGGLEETTAEAVETPGDVGEEPAEVAETPGVAAETPVEVMEEPAEVVETQAEVAEPVTEEPEIPAVVTGEPGGVEEAGKGVGEKVAATAEEALEATTEAASGLAAKVAAASEGYDEKIDAWFGETTGGFVAGVFGEFPVEVDGEPYPVKWVVIWLAAAGLIFTLVFFFINIRAFGLALRTLSGKYSQKTDPGEISHFQALASAVSGTVGLGNIAGVAIGISIAGPGVAFWLLLSGIFGMATKFAECTLGVRYRERGEDGKLHGGAMYYLSKGLEEKGMKGFGMLLAGIFGVFCVLASFGGGNVFQVNQATTQIVNVMGPDSYFAGKQWLLGLIFAAATGLVIIGGIKSIARVTSGLVPLMCLVYVGSAAWVLVVNAEAIPAAAMMIFSEAFEPRAAVTGGILAAFIWGMRRATFSNEAGIGSAPIAHAVVRTRKPASEGVVAMLEPFIDTVIVCTMTSLVIVSTMVFDGDSGNFTVHGQPYSLEAGLSTNAEGIGMTSNAFQTVNDNFQYVLLGCVVLFAFSTLITWSYYGLQAWQFLFGRKFWVGLSYKIIFCLVVVAGSAASMDNVVDFSDASLFAMAIPNLIGVYLLIPVVKREYRKFKEFAELIDEGVDFEEADRRTQGGEGIPVEPAVFQPAPETISREDWK